jgi:MFS family permease
MSQPPLFTRQFVILIVGHFLQALGFSSMLLLPLYLEHLGAGREQIGTLMALAAGGGLLSRPLAGWALDSWGRKPTLLVGTSLLVLSMGLLFFVRDLGWLIYLDRVILGVGVGTLFTGYFTWASDLIPAERRTEGIAYFGVSGLLPIALNGVVGELGVAPPDLRLLFAALSVVIALSVLAILALPETLDPDANTEGSEGLAGALRSLVAPRLWSLWVATAVFAGLVGLFFAFATVSARARGVANPPALWLAYSLGAVGVRLLGARLPDRLGPHNMVAPALAVYLGALVTCTRAESGEAFLLAGLLAGLAHGYCFPVLVSQVVGRTPDRWRGSAMAAFTAIWQLAGLLAPPLFGRVADSAHDALMWAQAGVAGAVGMVVWALLEGTVGRAPAQAS